MGVTVAPGEARGQVLVCEEPLSFWGGVDPATGRIVDAHHPQAGETVSDRILLMPTTRGSCSGSGVMLDLALTGRAPAALVFREAEEVATLGALIAGRMFDRPVPMLRLEAREYDALARAPDARIADDRIEAGDAAIPLAPLDLDAVALSAAERAMLDGREGRAVALAMELIRVAAALQGARDLTQVSRVHVDGCIYAAPAFLTFAETMAGMGARVRVPTTTNAISVDRENWERQGVARAFGEPAARLADAYLAMGAEPSFTCAPYLLADAPGTGERIAWAESNAVIFANSVLGARTVKHPDFLDLCIALTGRAPHAGVYRDADRRPRRILDVEVPKGADDALWPLAGWLAGRASPDRVPVLTGLEGRAPDRDALKALCAAFGTTSGAPMLHVAGVTPEAGLPPADGADRALIGPEAFRDAWSRLNGGRAEVDLVAFGSPHYSVTEARRLARALDGRKVAKGVTALVTLGRATLAELRADGTLDRLRSAGATVVPDLCWCSISEPVFPPAARVVMTDSGKYAHYGPALSGRQVRLGALADCVAAAVTGRAPPRDWAG